MLLLHPALVPGCPPGGHRMGLSAAQFGVCCCCILPWCLDALLGVTGWGWWAAQFGIVVVCRVMR